MGLFGIGRELQNSACSHGKPLANPRPEREGEHFYREERDVGRVIIKNFMTFHWLSPYQEREVFLLPVGLYYHHRV